MLILRTGDAGANRLGFCSASALGFGINCTNGRHLILGEKFKAIFALYLIGPKEGALDTAKGHIGMPSVRIIEHADVRRMLMYQRATLEAGRALLYSTYYNVDLSHEASDPEERQAAEDVFMIQNPLCKAYISDMAWKATAECIQCYGWYGFIEETYSTFVLQVHGLVHRAGEPGTARGGG